MPPPRHAAGGVNRARKRAPARLSWRVQTARGAARRSCPGTRRTRCRCRHRVPCSATIRLEPRYRPSGSAFGPRSRAPSRTARADHSRARWNSIALCAAVLLAESAETGGVAPASSSSLVSARLALPMLGGLALDPREPRGARRVDDDPRRILPRIGRVSVWVATCILSMYRRGARFARACAGLRPPATRGEAARTRGLRPLGLAALDLTRDPRPGSAPSQGWARPDRAPDGAHQPRWRAGGRAGHRRRSRRTPGPHFLAQEPRSGCPGRGSPRPPVRRPRLPRRSLGNGGVCRACGRYSNTSCRPTRGASGCTGTPAPVATHRRGCGRGARRAVAPQVVLHLGVEVLPDSKTFTQGRPAPRPSWSRPAGGSANERGLGEPQRPAMSASRYRGHVGCLKRPAGCHRAGPKIFCGPRGGSR